MGPNIKCADGSKKQREEKVESRKEIVTEKEMR